MIDKLKRMSRSTKSSQIEEELDYRASIAECFLDLSESCILNHAYDDALKYTDLAIDLFDCLNRDLSYMRIETSLRSIANFLPARKEMDCVEPLDPFRKPVCLHVLNEAPAFGGLVRMATRWIQLDGDARIHSVALLSQKSAPPPELVHAVRESGGMIYIADQKSSPLQHAVWLRDLARKLATYVILHIHPTSSLAAVAFGNNGGPPVLLVNHAAHIYWVGASVPDIIVNCRGSRLEEHWTKTHRGAKNCATIPIPLPEPGDLTPTETDRDELKLRARKIIGIPKESILIMTSGVSYKYKPFRNIDFLKTCQDILEAVPGAFVAVAGVSEDDRWRSISTKLDFRLRALGTLPQSEIALLHQASDIYIEGFPFGSTTALLEAGLQGVPVVLAPAECPPPYGSDGVALDDILERPASIEQYKLEVMRLCRNPAERMSVGMRLQKAIYAHHTGAGWNQYLTNALQALPPEHYVYPPQAPLRTPASIYEYWCEFQKTRAMSRGILEYQLYRAYSFGLRPKITPKMKLVCKNARRLRSGGAIPLPFLSLLCNYCLPLLPLSWARFIFRTVKFFFRGGLVSRVPNKVIRLFRRTLDSDSPYRQYQYIQKHSQWFSGEHRVP